MIPLPPPTNEIEIFSEEQLDILPKEAKASIIELGNNLPTKELLVLNPLVAKLLQIKELTKIKYVPLPEDPTKEDKEAYKANIEEFKEAKKEITSLKQQSAIAKKAIKGPLDALGKEVLNVERSINEIALEVLSVIEESFKPYTDEVAEKAAAALKIKTDKANEAINALSAENLAQANTFKKSTLITFLKYEMLGDTKLEVNNAIENYSLERLYALRDLIPLKTFESLTVGKELDLLSEEELTAVKNVFQNEIKQFISSINVKITTLELLKTNEKLSDTVEQQTEQLEIKSIPIPPQATLQVQGSPISNTDVFEVITNNNGNPYGEGANQNTVPVKLDIYPKNSNEVDFLDLVIEEITKCKDNIEYLRKRFSEDSNIVKSNEDNANIEKVRGAGFLLDKTIFYILDQLPKKQ